MRLGQILLESKLVTARQLSDALEYAAAKSIFLGKAMTLLKYLQEEDIARALEAQKMINMGLPSMIAIEAFKRSVKQAISMEKALESRHLERLLSSDVDKTSKSSGKTGEMRKDETTASLLRYGDNLLLEDSCSEAEAYFLKALSILETNLGPEHLDLAPVLIRLGNTYLALHSFDQARDYYERVLFIRTKHLGDDDPQIAQTFESLADLYKAQEDDARAAWAYLSALDVLEKSLPGQLVAYALILRKLTKSMQRNRPAAGRALPVGEVLKSAGLLSARELQSALRMSNRSSLPLGIVLRENGMIGDLELQSALKAQFCIRQGVVSEQLAINLLARACRRRVTLDRILDEAGILIAGQDKLDLYRQIAADLDQLVAVESSDVRSQTQLAPIAARLGYLYEQVGDKTRAEVYLSRALVAWGSASTGDVTVADTCLALARVLEGQSRQEEVVRLLRRALDNRQRALGNTHPDTIETLEEIAVAELELRNGAGALTYAQKALTYREEAGQTGMELLKSVITIGDAMTMVRNFEGAHAAYKRAMELAQPKDGSRPTPALAHVMEKMADMFKQQQLLKVAVPLYRSALLILEAAGRRDSQAFEALQLKISSIEQLVQETG